MTKNTDLDKLNKIQRLYDLECEKTADLQRQVVELRKQLEKLQSEIKPFKGFK